MTLQELKDKWPVLRRIHLEHGTGWYATIDRIMTAIGAAGFDPARDEIRQIKEKFGTLRFYLVCDALGNEVAEGSDDSNSKRSEAILQAVRGADDSGKFCEVCGQQGRLLVAGGWWLTRCTNHEEPGSVTPAEYATLYRRHRDGN